MSATRTKFIVITSLFLLCILGCIAIADVAKKNSEGQSPIRSLQVTLDESHREQLFSELQKFSEKYAFEIQIDEINATSGTHLNVWMSRDDILIIARDVPKAPTKVRISFYDKDPSRPALQETVNELVTDLISFISEIPNVTITEDK